MSLISGLVAAFIGLGAHGASAPVACHPYAGNWIGAPKSACAIAEGGHSQFAIRVCKKHVS